MGKGCQLCLPSLLFFSLFNCICLSLPFDVENLMLTRLYHGLSSFIYLLENKVVTVNELMQLEN